LLPPNAPNPLGKPIEMVAFVDSDHAGDLLTCRLHTGVLVYFNCSPILWYPSSVLKKKSNAIAYHSVRENVAAGVILIV
jgi:hypothetical protein